MADHRTGYLLELTPEDRLKARQELGEDQEQLASHLATFRATIANMKHLTAPDTDDFLLLFLRRAKFSQLKARQILETFIKHRVTDPHKEMFVQSPDLDAQVMKCFSAGVLMAIPRLDGAGVRTLVFQVAAIDVKEFSVRDAGRAAVALMEIALRDPVTQVNGIQYVSDEQNTPLAVYGQLMSPTTMRIVVSAFLNVMPCRMKGLHIYKGPSVVNKLVMLIKALVSSKIGSRMSVHSSEESLQAAVDPAVLPNEMGGTAGTYEELKNKTVDLVLRNKGIFARYSSIRYDEAQKLSDEDLSGTFRKLAV